MSKKVVILLIIVLLMICANLIWLDIQIISIINLNKLIITDKTDENNTNLTNDQQLSTSSSTLSLDILDVLDNKLKIATASIGQDILILKQDQKSNNLKNSSTNQKMVKEYYLPMGTGFTTGSEWTDITGAEAYLTPSNYNKIKEIYFEANFKLPTGQGKAYARLLNVTDNVGLIESEIYRDGTQTGIVSSGKIPVPVNTKLYRVQMKSTLGVQVVLDSSRIKLIIE